MPSSSYRLGASIWGFFGRRAAEDWPSLADAARSILSLDSALGLEVWASQSLEIEEASDEQLAELADVCRSAPFVAVHVRGAFWGWAPADLRREIDFAEHVGAETLVLHSVCLGITRPEDRLDVPEIRRIATYAADREVRLALENMADSVWLLDRVLEEVGDDPRKTNLGICIDIGHAYLSHDAGREPVANYLERYAAQLLHLHLHDNHGASDEHLIPGDGAIDWSRCLRTLERIGFDGTAVLEVHPPEDLAAIDGIRKGLGFLGSTLA